MNHATLTPALLLALVAFTLVSPAALAGEQPATPAEAQAQASPCEHHCAGRFLTTTGAPDSEREPRATYGMITLTRIQVIANTLTPDWETIRFLEVNLAGSPSHFAFAPAPQG